ncbi:glycosyltransferase [Luteibacter aegosomatis]|uniref:glycosyltransferase n=1 Tax=Luteibacter aegosomatis TaxID=2911537 RepID=UPI003CE4D158
MKPSGTLALLIPCLNEERALGSLLTELKSLRLPIIVVDDGSTDGTLDVALAHDVRVVRHDTCQGKGNALRSGWTHARDWGYTGVIRSTATASIGPTMWQPCLMPPGRPHSRWSSGPVSRGGMHSRLGADEPMWLPTGRYPKRPGRSSPTRRAASGITPPACWI